VSAEERERLRQAKQWFDEGVAAEKSGDCDTAVDRYLQALEVKQTPQLNLRIGLCLETLGQLLGAKEAYQTALDLPIDNAKLKATLEAQRDAVEARIPRLVLRVPRAVEGLDLRIDGVRAKPDEPIQVDPGARKIRAEAPAHEPFEREETLAEGEEREVTITLRSSKVDDAAPPPEEPAEEASSTGPGALPWVFIGAGAAALGAGIALFASAGGPLSDADRLCGGNRGFCQTDGAATRDQIDELVGEANTREALGTAALIAGAGLAATGVVWLLLPSEEPAASDASASSLVATPWASPLGAGLLVGGRF
jgi:tetratricopeptide (TPR) repeat protein